MMKKMLVLLVFVFVSMTAFACDEYYEVKTFTGVVYPDSVVGDYYQGELVNFSFTLNFNKPQMVIVTPGIMENRATRCAETDDLETLMTRLVNASLIGARIEICAAKVGQREYRLFSVHFVDDNLWYFVG
jgi:hypothetical protein